MATGFSKIGDAGSARDDGRLHTAHFRKVPSQASSVLGWVDLSMAGGNPKPNYYASTPLAAEVLDGFDGVFHGDDKAPNTMHLAGMGVMGPAAFVGRLQMLDYLLYYPFIDGDAVGEEQVMDNTVELPRYADGAGLQVMAVCAAPTTGGGSFTYTYVDELGNERTSAPITVNTAVTNIASILTGDSAVAGIKAGPFLPHVGSANGVRRINSVNVQSAIGGLMTLVIVKVLGTVTLRDAAAPNEVEFIRQKAGAPEVLDGAYLNFIANPAASVAAQVLTGWAHFIWSK